MLAELSETEWCGGHVHIVRPNILHLMRGEVFDIDGTTVLAMGGAASHDREWREEGKSWWPEEMPNAAEMDRCRRSLDRAGWNVDYVVTGLECRLRGDARGAGRLGRHPVLGAQPPL